MNPGLLDRHIEIRCVKAAAERDALNEIIPDYETIYRGMARFQDASSRAQAETDQNQKRVFQRTADFTIRYCGGVVAADLQVCEILYDGHVWDISGIVEVGRRMFLKLTAYWRDSIDA